MPEPDRSPMQPSLLALAVLVALVSAALMPTLRPVVLVALGLGALLARPGSMLLWAAAAGLPVALILAWGSLVGSDIRDDVLGCGDIASPSAILRIAAALIVSGLVVLLARRLGVTLGSLGLQRPRRTEAALGLLAVLVIPMASLLIGPLVAEPFFGPIRLELSVPQAIVPALGLAVANGTMEELAYRGALMTWMSRVTGPGLAVVGQAIVFGLAHTGADYVASPLPVVLAVTAGGLLAAVVVRRTGSLWLAIAVHAAVDIPVYYAAACRLG
jgi:membrane protease YdiL (CAAX protease family)